MKKRMKMYATASYNINGMIFSLNDIEHGILRNNSQSPVPISKLNFPKGDARCKY